MKRRILAIALLFVLSACANRRVLQDTDFEDSSLQKIPLTSAPKKQKALNSVKTENGYTTMVINGLTYKGYQSISKEHFLRASEIAEKMLSKIPDVRKTLVETQFMVFLINAETNLTDHPEYADMKGKTFHQYTQGLRENDSVRGITEQYICAVDEMTLYNPLRNVMIHEFAHAIMFAMTREDQDDIRKAYNHALLGHLYSQKEYVMENSWEYWAVLSEAWLRYAPELAASKEALEWQKSHHPNSMKFRVREDIQKNDPQAAQILERFYGDIVITDDYK
ncbi:MAG: anthrax toxin lethal factor-related metalloendopeptidase [Pseudobdellovibrio sp.]